MTGSNHKHRMSNITINQIGLFLVELVIEHQKKKKEMRKNCRQKIMYYSQKKLMYLTAESVVMVERLICLGFFLHCLRAHVQTIHSSNGARNSLSHVSTLVWIVIQCFFFIVYHQ